MVPLVLAYGFRHFDVSKSPMEIQKTDDNKIGP